MRYSFHRTGLCSLSLAMAALGLGGFADTASDPLRFSKTESDYGPRAQKLRQFLENPPGLSHFVFAERQFPYAFTNESGGSATNKLPATDSYYFFVAAFDKGSGMVVNVTESSLTNGMDGVIRELAGPSLVFAGPLLSVLTAASSMSWYTTNILDPALYKPSGTAEMTPTSSAMFQRYRLNMAMNLGLFNIQPGTIRWKGTNFSANFPARNQAIHGFLTTSTNGDPSSLTAYFDTAEHSAKYRYDYFYGKEVSHGLPSEIYTRQIDGDQEILRGHLRILSVDERPLPAGISLQALRDRVRPAAGLPDVWVTNNVRYLNTNGALVEFSVTDEYDPQRRMATTLAFYASIGAMVLIISILYLRHGRMSRTMTG